MRHLFKSIPSGVMLDVCSEKENELHTAQRNITVGSSIFFISIVETNDKSNDKYILRNANNGVKDIKGCDANSNCFLAIMQKVNIDFTDTSRKNDKFKELRVRSYTVKDLQWLSCVAHIKTPNNKTNIRDGKYLWGSQI